MSKKHFVELADKIRANRAEFGPGAIAALAEFCASQNPRFDVRRWLDYIGGRCGPNGGKVRS